jgi:hypothetical protein
MRTASTSLGSASAFRLNATVLPDGPPVPDDTGPLIAAITDAITHRDDLPAEARTA